MEILNSRKSKKNKLFYGTISPPSYDLDNEIDIINPEAEATSDEFTATFSVRDWAGEHRTRIAVTGTAAAIALAATSLALYYRKHHKKD